MQMSKEMHKSSRNVSQRITNYNFCFINSLNTRQSIYLKKETLENKKYNNKYFTIIMLLQSATFPACFLTVDFCEYLFCDANCGEFARSYIN